MGETISITCGFCNYEKFIDGGDGFIYCELCNSKHDTMIYIDLDDNSSQCESSSQLSELLKNLDLNQNEEITRDTIDIPCSNCNNVGFIFSWNAFLYCKVCGSKADHERLNAAAKLLSQCEQQKNQKKVSKMKTKTTTSMKEAYTINKTCGYCKVGFIVGGDEYLYCGVCGLKPDEIETMTIALENEDKDDYKDEGSTYFQRLAAAAKLLPPSEPFKNLECYNQMKGFYNRGSGYGSLGAT